jgi:hypothetical protein
MIFPIQAGSVSILPTRQKQHSESGVLSFERPHECGTPSRFRVNIVPNLDGVQREGWIPLRGQATPQAAMLG